MSAAAELLADRGEAAASAADFFRCRPFLDAEGVTHSLRIEADGVDLLAPLLVRPIPTRGDGDEGGERDAVSPYGYPGLGRRPRDSAPAPQEGAIPVDPAAVDLSATGLVSCFIRHTLADPPPLAGARERNVVQIADPELPRKMRSSDRNQINRNRRNGYEVLLVPGPETDRDQRAGFLAAYEQTMRRTGAGERYFFGERYFDLLLESPLTWLALALDREEAVAAASIAALSDGYLHYYLSGTLDSHLRDSPMKNVVARLVEHGEELGRPLNLGGGISAGDALEEFKRGFANRELVWRTSELVCDPAAYARLSAHSPRGDFFPAYRAPRG